MTNEQRQFKGSSKDLPTAFIYLLLAFKERVRFREDMTERSTLRQNALLTGFQYVTPYLTYLLTGFQYVRTRLKDRIYRHNHEQEYLETWNSLGGGFPHELPQNRRRSKGRY